METKSFREIFETADGSPSARDPSAHSGGTAQPMHSTQGALGESLHVYSPALRFHFELHHPLPLRVWVVGLGLGYLEMISAALCLVHQQELFLLSSESNPALIADLQQWLQGEPSPVHDLICSLVAGAIFQGQHPSAFDLKKRLIQLWKENKWHFQGKISVATLPTESFHAVLFDAYSPAATPELWDEGLLNRLLQWSMSPDLPASFATYASRSSLKRALRSQGFRIEKRPGFGGKRECTLAMRR